MGRTFVSPTLYDGPEVTGIKCDKEDDGRLHCFLDVKNKPHTTGASGINEVRVIGGSKKSRHMGPQDDSHIHIEFGHGNPAKCHHAVGDNAIECHREPR